MPAASTYSAIMTYGTAWGLGKETTYGTAVVPDTNAFIPFISESVEETFDVFDVRNSRNRFTQKTLNRGRKHAAGDVEIHVEPETIGYVLFYLFGSAGAPATVDTSARTHTFNPVAATIDSFTSQFGYGASATRGKQVPGCKITGVTFTFGEDVVTASVSLAGQKVNDMASPAAPSYSANMHRPFTFRDAKMEINGANGGTTYTGMEANIIGGSITVTAEHFTEDFRQGNDTIQSMPTGYFSYEGQLEIVYSYDATLDTWFTGAAERDVVVYWEGELAGATTTKHQFKLLMPATFVTKASPTQTHGERVVRSVSFKGFHDEAQSVKNIQAVLTNKHTGTYPA